MNSRACVIGKIICFLLLNYFCTIFLIFVKPNDNTLAEISFNDEAKTETKEESDCILFDSLKLRKVGPGRAKKRFTVLVVSFYEDVYSLFSSIPSSKIFCFKSIYDYDNSYSKECRIEIVFSQQPLKETEASLKKYNFVIHIQKEPGIAIMNLYFESNNSSSSVLFQEFSISKSIVWKVFQNFWLQKSSLSSRGYYEVVEFEDLVIDPSALIEPFWKLSGILTPFEQVRECFNEKLNIWSLNERHNLVQQKKLWKSLPRSSLLPLLDLNRIYYCLLVHNSISGYDYDCPAMENSESILLDRNSNAAKEIHLLTTFYVSSNENRRKELEYALLSNVNNIYFSKVHLWIDGHTKSEDIPIVSDKIIINYALKQPLYSDLFSYANKYHNECCIFVIQNGDIFWRSSAYNMTKLPPGSIFALSRHSSPENDPHTRCDQHFPHNNNFCIKYKGSHDAFVFAPPIDPAAFKQLNFKQNTWGAENTLIESFRYAGYSVYNPCMDVQPIHYHCSNYRVSTGGRIGPPDVGLRRILRGNSVEYPKRLDSILKLY